MRTTVDIPDPIYRRLKSEATLRGCSVKDLVLVGVKAKLEEPKVKRKRMAVRLPLIHSKRPGQLKLTNRRINDLLLP